MGRGGLGQSADGLGWIGSHKMDPWTTLRQLSIDISCRPTWRSAGKPPATAAAVKRWDRQTDRQTDGRTDTRPVVLKWQPDFAGDERCSTVTSYVHMKAP